MDVFTSILLWFSIGCLPVIAMLLWSAVVKLEGIYRVVADIKWAMKVQIGIYEMDNPRARDYFMEERN